MGTLTHRHSRNRHRLVRRARARRLAARAAISSVVGLVAAATAAPGASATDVPQPTSTPPNGSLSGFDARASAAPYAYCLDLPQILIGQKICGASLQSNATTTSDPRGYALAGIAPVPKAGSLSLAIPNRVPTLDIPIPSNVTDALKKFEFDNTPLQCQAVYPPVRPVDADRTCGGPTAGDGNLGFVASGSNARVQSTGVNGDPMATRTTAESRAYDVREPGLQSTSKNTYSLAEAALDAAGVPTAVADLRSQEFDFAAGLLNIQGLRSESSVATDGTGKGTRAFTSFSYSAATVFGIPVNITTHGVELADQLVPNPLVPTYTKTLNDALASIPALSIRLLPAPPVSTQNGLVSAQSAGIEITYHSTEANAPFKGTPLEGNVQQILGQSMAAVSAVDSEPLADEPTTGGLVGPIGPASSTQSPPATDAGYIAGRSAQPDFLGTATETPRGEDTASATGARIAYPTETSAAGGLELEPAAVISPLSPTGLQHVYPGILAVVFGTFLATRLRRRSSILAPGTGSAGSTS